MLNGTIHNIVVKLGGCPSRRDGVFITDAVRPLWVVPPNQLPDRTSPVDSCPRGYGFVGGSSHPAMVLRTERQLEAGVGPIICKTPQPITDIIHPRLVAKQPTFFLLFCFLTKLL